MLSQSWRKSLGVGTAALTGLLLLGILKVIDLEPTTNLFNTGITLGIIFGIASLIVAMAIYKNWIENDRNSRSNKSGNRICKDRIRSS